MTSLNFKNWNSSWEYSYEFWGKIHSCIIVVCAPWSCLCFMQSMKVMSLFVAQEVVDMQFLMMKWQSFSDKFGGSSNQRRWWTNRNIIWCNWRGLENWWKIVWCNSWSKVCWVLGLYDSVRAGTIANFTYLDWLIYALLSNIMLEPGRLALFLIYLWYMEMCSVMSLLSELILDLH